MNREQLMAMPISQLRGLDITTTEDELLVQEVLNEKLANEPSYDPSRPVLSSRETDGLTPEKEKELQARLDGEMSEVTMSGPVELVTDPVTTSEPVTSSEKKSFCEFCIAKGPVKHMGNCTRLSANLNTNV